MSINNTQSRIANAQASLRNMTSKSSKNSDELRKQDFMNLFMTQMSHQDPLSPMDSGAMMTQLAQLGSMEQLENLNTQFTELNTTQKDISRFQALQFLDRDVMMKTQSVELGKGHSKPIHFNLDQDVDSLTVVIEEMDGSPVFSEKLGLTVAGNHQFNWDGKDDEGNLMGDGTYSIKLKTLTKDGESGTINAYNAGRISRVEYRKGQPWVKVSDAMIPLSKVTTVDNLSQRLFGDAVPLPIKEDLVPKGMFNDVGETKK